jgi:hypothetical protein
MLLKCALCLLFYQLSAAGAGILETNVPGAFTNWAIHSPDSIDWDSASFSNGDWFVWTESGHVMVDTKPREQADALPFKLNPVQKKGEVDLAGDRCVLAVDNGYLIGFDAGEFGGGLWWFSKDGTRHRKLSLRASDSLDDYYPENVHGLVRNGSDVLAFEGLTHLGLNSGRVVKVSRSTKGEWQVSLFAELGACPHAIVEESPSSWLLATTSGVWRLDAHAQKRVIWQPVGGHLYYPNSIARDSNGVVFMGMRHYVIRLIPGVQNSYSVQVLERLK